MNGWEILGDAMLSLVPPALVGLLFYVVMRSIIRADRGEREEYNKIETEERQRRDQSQFTRWRTRVLFDPPVGLASAFYEDIDFDSIVRRSIYIGESVLAVYTSEELISCAKTFK